MPENTTQFEPRKGTTAEHASFTGADNEATWDSDKKCWVGHDGSTAGGFPHLLVADVLDEDNMASDSAVYPSSQQSIKAYVDAQVGTVNKTDATAAPDSDDDGANTGGNGLFTVGSYWIDTTADEAYRCVDASTGAAVWVGTSLELSDLGSIVTQDSDSVSITGGSVSGITDLAVADGGTGASDAATARTNLGLGTAATQASSAFETADADILKADTADVLTAGFATTVYDAGTKSSGTYTPDEANGNIQNAVNGGAHTLAPPTNNCTMLIQYTNNGSAGAITTSSFTLVDGDTISTTNGDDFFFYITKANGFSLLTVKALQ